MSRKPQLLRPSASAPSLPTTPGESRKRKFEVDPRFEFDAPKHYYDISQEPDIPPGGIDDPWFRRQHILHEPVIPPPPPRNLLDDGSAPAPPRPSTPSTPVRKQMDSFLASLPSPSSQENSWTPVRLANGGGSTPTKTARQTWVAGSPASGTKRRLVGAPATSVGSTDDQSFVSPLATKLGSLGVGRINTENSQQQQQQQQQQQRSRPRILSSSSTDTLGAAQRVAPASAASSAATAPPAAPTTVWDDLREFVDKVSVPGSEGTSTRTRSAPRTTTAPAAGTKKHTARSSSSSTSSRQTRPASGAGVTRSASASVLSSRNTKASEEDELRALLSAHNKRVQPAPAYVPLAHSVREVREWERSSGRRWYDLTPTERMEVNLAIAKRKGRR